MSVALYRIRSQDLDLVYHCFILQRGLVGYLILTQRGKEGAREGKGVAKWSHDGFIVGSGLLRMVDVLLFQA